MLYLYIYIYIYMCLFSLQVVSKLNRKRAKIESKKKYSEALSMTLLLTGSVLLLPLVPLSILSIKKQKEVLFLI